MASTAMHALIDILARRQFREIDIQSFDALRDLMQEAEKSAPRLSLVPLRTLPPSNTPASTITTVASGPFVTGRQEPVPPLATISSATSTTGLRRESRIRERIHSASSAIIAPPGEEQDQHHRLNEKGHHCPDLGELQPCARPRDRSTDKKINLLVNSYPDKHFQKALNKGTFSTNDLGLSVLNRSRKAVDSFDSATSDESIKLWNIYDLYENKFEGNFLRKVVELRLAQLYPPGRSRIAALASKLTAELSIERKEKVLQQVKTALKYGRRWQVILELCGSQAWGAILLLPKRFVLC